MTEERNRAPISGAIQTLFGTGDENVRLLETLLGVHIALRGGEITVEGETEKSVDMAQDILSSLAALCERGERVDTALVQYAVRLAEKNELDQLDTLFKEYYGSVAHSGVTQALGKNGRELFVCRS